MALAREGNAGLESRHPRSAQVSDPGCTLIYTRVARIRRPTSPSIRVLLAPRITEKENSLPGCQLSDRIEARAAPGAFGDGALGTVRVHLRSGRSQPPR